MATTEENIPAYKQYKRNSLVSGMLTSVACLSDFGNGIIKIGAYNEDSGFVQHQRWRW